MKQIETEIMIKATPERVWKVLMDFDQYPQWNPFIKSISGEKHMGATLKVFLQPPDFSGMTIRPKVKAVIENREFRWKGQLLLPGLFDGEHYFRIEEQTAGQVRFVHGEYFTGILVGLFASILAKTKIGFEQMNQAIKVKSEK